MHLLIKKALILPSDAGAALDDARPSRRRERDTNCPAAPGCSVRRTDATAAPACSARRTLTPAPSSNGRLPVQEWCDAVQEPRSKPPFRTDRCLFLYW
jgi:hypothetical protein